MENYYKKLNLKKNPFGELTVAERKMLAVVDDAKINEWMKLVNSPNHILQLVADHGRGKTTHLLKLHEQCSDIPYIKLIQPINMQWINTPTYFVDSIENLSLPARLKLYKKYHSLVVTTHRNLSYEMKMMGKHVTSIDVSQMSLNHLYAMFAKRVDFVSGNEKYPVPSMQLLQNLQTHFGDDIRSMEGVLFELYFLLSRQQNSVKPSSTNVTSNQKMPNPKEVKSNHVRLSTSQLHQTNKLYKLFTRTINKQTLAQYQHQYAKKLLADDISLIEWI